VSRRDVLRVCVVVKIERVSIKRRLDVLADGTIVQLRVEHCTAEESAVEERAILQNGGGNGAFEK
jgi:hypothetical protein